MMQSGHISIVASRLKSICGNRQDLIMDLDASAS
jgi:hypothetical protein